MARVRLFCPNRSVDGHLYFGCVDCPQGGERLGRHLANLNSTTTHTRTPHRAFFYVCFHCTELEISEGPRE